MTHASVDDVDKFNKTDRVDRSVLSFLAQTSSAGFVAQPSEPAEGRCAYSMTDAGRARMDADPARAALLVSRIRLGRFAEPCDLVGAAVFLAGAASDFVTGQTLFVDGGFTA